MSKKQLHSRIENLFKDLDSNTTERSEPSRPQFSGWYWECTLDGEYLYCSPEIEDCLGISPATFRGQSIFRFQLLPESCAKMRSAFQQESYPREVELFYLAADGERIPGRVNILTQTEKNDIGPCWQGFVQILPLSKEITTSPKQALDPIQPDFKTVLPGPTHIGKKTPTGPLKVNGIALESGSVHPTSSLWTTAAIQSLSQNQPVTHHGENGGPSSLAVPLHLNKGGIGIVEIVDDNNQQRRWSDDERLLVQEVTNQLSLALENAELYQTVQSELSERIRAEQEISNRNQELATLNLAGQQLSRLTTPQEILDLLSSILGQLLDNRNMAVALFDGEKRMVSYPVMRVNGLQISIDSQTIGNDTAGYLFWTKKSLLITRNAASELVDRGISLPDTIPASLIGIPLLAGERSVGAIILQDFEREGAYSSVHVELLSTLASQVTTALENAKLFQEIRNALASIENRERYQANVALVAATLSRYGSKSLPEVLASLGQAAQCSRVFYASPVEDGQGEVYLEIQMDWIDPLYKSAFSQSTIKQLPASHMPFVLEQIHKNGWVANLVEELPSPDREMFFNQNEKSILALPVPGKGSIPGLVVFEQIEKERIWQNEEINILQVATDALSNTVLRENLLKQVQVSLHETENLYNLSHNLALASDLPEMLISITEGLQTPDIDRAELIIFEYGGSENQVKLPVSASWSSENWQSHIIGYCYDPALFLPAFARAIPVFIDRLEDSSISIELRSIWSDENIHAIAILPLWAGKRQTGVLLLESKERNVFGALLRRTVPPLVDQLATSVENMRLFTETQDSLAKTGRLYSVSNAISQAVNTRDLVMVIANNLMPAGTERVTLSTVQLNSSGVPTDFEVLGQFDLEKGFSNIEIHYTSKQYPLVTSLTTEPMVIPDINQYTVDESSRILMQAIGLAGICIIPLMTTGRLVGLIAVSSKKRLDVSQEEINNLQMAANGIAVALEKQKLLAEAQRRALELQTAAELARDTISTLSLDQLLERIVNLLCERFDFYHASIFLLDKSRRYAVIRESTGDAGKDMKERGHKLAVGSKSIIGTVTGNGNPLIINDISQSPIFYANPFLPETRSEMGIPLKVGTEVIGALDIQSKRANAFNQDDVVVLQVLSDQIAIAIENARAYELSQQAVEEMREVDRMKSQFLANMSHELRTPLNSIIGFSRVILKGIDGQINETQGEDLTAIYNSGQHLLALINDILDLSKIEAGKMELSFSEVSIHDLVNSVMATAAGLIKGKPVKLHQVIPDDLPAVWADNTRVRQVLLNLLSNASKFTEQGSITLVARVIHEQAKPEVLVTVTDTGNGIASEDTHKLFQPFSQVDDSPTRKTGGTGLGLSICRSLIEMHGGRIGLLRSEVGVGSTFFFTLPLAKNLPEPVPEFISGDDRIVLAVDDDAQVIGLYERYLRPHGYQVIALTDPKKAVQIAKEINPSAITLDVMMPERDGWQVMHDLKNDSETRNIPIIICSILEEEEKGFNLGAADYLVKPFAQDDLLIAINRLNANGQIHNILVIDDSPDDLRLVQKILEEKSPYQVKTAEGGQAGWEAILSNPPDGIILDLFMPGMNGFDLLDRLRTYQNLRTIPVVILTGADITIEQQQQLAEFGQNLLAKGTLNEKELLTSLELSLNRFRQSERSPYQA